MSAKRRIKKDEVNDEEIDELAHLFDDYAEEKRIRLNNASMMRNAFELCQYVEQNDEYETLISVPLEDVTFFSYQNRYNEKYGFLEVRGEGINVKLIREGDLWDGMICGQEVQERGFSGIKAITTTIRKGYLVILVNYVT